MKVNSDCQNLRKSRIGGRMITAWSIVLSGADKIQDSVELLLEQEVDGKWSQEQQEDGSKEFGHSSTR